MLEELCNTPVGADLPNSYKPNKYLYKSVNSGATPARLLDISKKDPLALAKLDQVANLHTDYLANGGAALEEACNNDSVTKSRLRDALELFIGFEAQSRDKIEAAIAEANILVPSPRK